MMVDSCCCCDKDDDDNGGGDTDDGLLSVLIDLPYPVVHCQETLRAVL